MDIEQHIQATLIQREMLQVQTELNKWVDHIKTPSNLAYRKSIVGDTRTHSLDSNMSVAVFDLCRTEIITNLQQRIETLQNTFEQL
ncbi:MAG: hypothetical protein KAS32_05555 [Candidatus Peribacteraceae bacterium]|nr:hypothetical protein [Candidatus Peribacteraceae bacterium]